MSKLNNFSSQGNLVHDINSTLSALLSALELVNDEWKTNPELVDKILPLTEQKVQLLKEQINLYRHYPN